MPHHLGGHAPYSTPDPQTDPRLDETPPEAREAREARENRETEEVRGCLFALSQPPLMLFLAVICGLLMLTALHDLFLL